ncbi:hypothetical protein BKA83DRAFT_18403 [Pisolithus microcarpus]|nr:hypothetical protein BKA83DRAFT_18403 [Pisolithus microcarpus]
MTDYSPAELIDWTTVVDDDLMPSAADSMDVEIAKIDEQARRQRERVLARRRQEEEDRRRKEEEDEHRRKEEEEQRRKEEVDARRQEEEKEAETRRLAEEAEKEVRVRAEKDAENEAVVAKTISWAPLAGVSTPNINGAFELRITRVSIIRDHPCTLCITTGEPCIDLTDSRSKQCAKCFRQKKGCRLPGEKIQEKRKDPQLSPCAGEKRKRVKVVGEDDHPGFVSTSMPIVRPSAGAMGTSATAVPDSVARVLDQRLCEIASLLRNLVGQVKQSADPEEKGWSLEVDQFAVDKRDGDADEADADGEDNTDLGGATAN